MSKSHKPILIIGGIALVAGVGGAIFISKALSEHGTRRVVTQQVEAWAPIWRDVRACFVGDEPAAKDPGDALFAVLGQQPNVQNALRECDRGLRKLVRPGDESTGEADVESAWAALEKSISRLARAYATALADGETAPLGAALREMDASYAALRNASRMKPDPPAGDALPSAGAPTPIGPDGEAMAIISGDEEANTLVLKGETGDGAGVIATVRGADQIAYTRVATDVIRASTRGDAWAAATRSAGDGSEIAAGPLGDDGQLGDGAARVVAAASADEALDPLYAAGVDANRVILYLRVDPRTGEPALWEARSADGGATWQTTQLDEQPRRVWISHLEPRFDAIWVGDDGAVRWRYLDPAVSTTLSEPIALPGAEVELCVAPGAVWWRWDRTLYRADAGAASLDEVGTLRDQPQRFACDAKRALSVSTSGTIVEAELCTAAACELAVTAEAPGYSRFAAGFTASGAVVVTRFEDVGLVWRGAENPAPIKLPEGTLRGAFEWGGAIYITLENDDKVSLSKLPTP